MQQQIKTKQSLDMQIAISVIILGVSSVFDILAYATFHYSLTSTSVILPREFRIS